MTQTTTDGARLAQTIRTSMGDMSGRALAKATGLHPSLVARILRGERDVTVTELTLVATALGVTPADLIPLDAA